MLNLRETVMLNLTLSENNQTVAFYLFFYKKPTGFEDTRGHYKTLYLKTNEGKALL